VQWYHETKLVARRGSREDLAPGCSDGILFDDVVVVVMCECGGDTEIFVQSRAEISEDLCDIGGELVNAHHPDVS
jgi:hypothetical protein